MTFLQNARRSSALTIISYSLFVIGVLFVMAITWIFEQFYPDPAHVFWGTAGITLNMISFLSTAVGFICALIAVLSQNPTPINYWQIRTPILIPLILNGIWTTFYIFVVGGLLLNPSFGDDLLK